MIDALARIGYSLHDALADIIDNSVDASARHVLVRFIRDDNSVQRIIVVDDGRGMLESELSRAMVFGSNLDHARSDLGKYGIGLKTASFSQCQTVSVLTSRDGLVSGRRWNVEMIKRGWLCERLDAAACRSMLGEDWHPVSTAKSGTLIAWDRLDRLDIGKQGVDAALGRFMRRLPIELGLVFHRYLSSERVTIAIDTQHSSTGERGPVTVVQPLDPVGYSRSGRNGYPCVFRVQLTDGPPFQLAAHIWPASSKGPEYRLGGGKVAARQGFYFYRNDRLIQAGGWNGWREHDAEPHSSLARVVVDLPPELDTQFQLNVQKSKVEAPPSFVDALERARSGNTTMRDYIRDAVEVYRTEGTSKSDRALPVTLGSGLPAKIRNNLRRTLAADARATREVDIVWANLDDDAFFVLDRDKGCVVLNRKYRAAVLQGARASAADAPLVKTLLFLVVQKEFSHQRDSAVRKKGLEDLNTLLLTAAQIQLDG
jgi:hypothetical protein